MRRFQSVLVITLLALLAGLIEPVGTTAASAAVTCLPNNPLAPAHNATNLSPSGISGRPSANIGQAAVEPPAPGQPSWNGNDRVNDVIQIGGTVYAAGLFKTWIWKGANYPRQNIVAFNATTGEPTAFAPQVNNEIFSLTPSCDGSAVFIGGVFTSVGGQPRNYAAEISVATSAPTGWNPKPNGWVTDVSVMHGHLVVSGYYDKMAVCPGLTGPALTLMARARPLTAGSIFRSLALTQMVHKGSPRWWLIMRIIMPWSSVTSTRSATRTTGALQ